MKLSGIVILAMATLIWQGNASPALRVVHLESVDYPRLAVFAQIQGEVAVEVKIDANGKVVSAYANSGHQLLRREAEENIKKWTFTPGAERNLEVLFEFRLKKPEMNEPCAKTTFDLPDKVLVVSNFIAPQG